MFEIILFEPEIPPNTGNIIRLCANTGARLHLIQPLGFQLEDRRLRRAGLDYHEWARVREYPDLARCLAELGLPRLFRLHNPKPSSLPHRGLSPWRRSAVWPRNPRSASNSAEHHPRRAMLTHPDANGWTQFKPVKYGRCRLVRGVAAVRLPWSMLKA